MTDPQTPPPVPPDDGVRRLTLVGADDPGLRHIAVVGDTYTVLVSGEDTGGRYTLIDMLIPAGGGPPPHRHDFEEMFHVLEGEIEVTVRGEPAVVRPGQTANVPANAPHSFRNATDQTVRLLAMAAPSGLEEYFAAAGDAVDTRTSPAPELSDDARAERMRKAIDLAPSYGFEVLPPGRRAQPA